MVRSLGKMADPRAQEVLSGDCGPIAGQYTLTAVFRSVGDFPQYGHYLRLLSFNRKVTSGGRKSLNWERSPQDGRHLRWLSYNREATSGGGKSTNVSRVITWSMGPTT